jgi:hypothetical protein
MYQKRCDGDHDREDTDTVYPVLFDKTRRTHQIMKYSGIFIRQFLVFLCFASLFVYGSLYQRNVIDTIESEKFTYPILIYSYDGDAAIDILRFVQDKVSTIFFFTPENLQNLLIDKYELQDYEYLADELPFPFMIEAYLSPSLAPVIGSIIEEILLQFSESISQLQFNEKLWNDIDLKVNSLRTNLLVIEIFALLAYLFIQLFVRYNYCIKFKDDINAVLSAGIKKSEFRKKELLNSILFVIISQAVIIAANYALYYYEYFITDIEQLILSTHTQKLLIANFLIALLQKPVYKDR